MVEYRLLTQEIYFNSQGSYSSYGIIVFENNAHIRTIADISVNKADVEKLIEIFNTHQLAPCHLSQAVEDYLSDLSTI